MEEEPIMNTIDNILSKLNSILIGNGHIKKTINNPESSRGIFFLTFEIYDIKRQQSGYFTVVDMASIENPIEIKKIYFRDTASTTAVLKANW